MDFRVDRTNSTLFMWCVEQARARRNGNLDQEKIEKLNSVGFPWEHYEKEADRIDKIDQQWAKETKSKKQ